MFFGFGLSLCFALAHTLDTKAEFTPTFRDPGYSILLLDSPYDGILSTIETGQPVGLIASFVQRKAMSNG